MEPLGRKIQIPKPGAISWRFKPKYSRAIQYGLAILSVALALQFTLLLQPLMEHNIFLLFLAAVVIVAWHAAPGPTLTAAALSALLAHHYFLHPLLAFTPDPGDFPQLGIFLIVSLIISLMSVRRRRAESELKRAHQELESRIRERTAELAKANKSLELQMAERRSSDEALQSSEARYRGLFRQIKNAVAVYEACPEGEDFIFKDFNPAGERIEKTKAQDLIGKRVTQVFPGIKEMGLLDVLWRVWRTGIPEHHPASLYRDEHIAGWRENSVYKLPTGEVMAVYEDVTERRQAEEALLQAERKYRSLFENAVEGIFQSTPEGRFLTVNPALARILGYSSPEELVGGIHDITHQIYADPERRREYARLLEEHGFVLGFECQLNRKDGSTIWGSFCTRAVRDADGKLVCFEGTMDEITERKRMEAQFRQAQKMEAVGVLAGGVAHDFNNLLTVINGNTEMLLSDLAQDDPRRGELELIKEAGLRAVSLTSQLLAFSRKQILQLRLLDLNDVVAENSKILARLIGEDIDLIAVAQPDLGLVMADAGQIQQIIMNLAVNARDAMPRGGKLTIETADVDLDEEYVRSHEAVPAGRYVMLAISDNGIGMDAKTRARIFEPFFTTKGPGKGTGLGLSTVYGIVKQSGGFIWVYSEPGCGTTFKIYLPRVEGKAGKPDGPAGEGLELQGVETVLVVEDDSSVRTLIVRVLKRRGYKVIEASNAGEALQAAREFAGDIHLVLTDVVMPEMSGKALASQIEAERPGIRVLFVSGYTNDAIVHHGVLDTGVAFLQKPFTSDFLARKVREVLDFSKNQAT